MLVIGLTGGIASGKTTIAQQFAKLGVAIIDTDIIAKEIVLPDSIALKQIIKHFGNKIIQQNGQLNRKKLRDIIFHDNKAKQWLEELLHPLIQKQAAQQINAIKNQAYCIVIVPLLVESQIFQGMVDRVLVVDTTVEQQLQRLIKRDKLSHDQALTIVNAQSTREQRLALADDIIYNHGDPKELEQQVNTLHNKYLTE